MPRSLDLDRLKQFEKVPAAENSPPVRTSPPETERWPSREPVRDGQISIKAPTDVIEQFRRLCKEDRRTYADMLSTLMKKYDHTPKGR